MQAHGVHTNGDCHAERCVSGGWWLSRPGQPTRWYRSLAECQRIIKEAM
jgi:hypothetical protein